MDERGLDRLWVFHSYPCEACPWGGLSLRYLKYANSNLYRSRAPRCTLCACAPSYCCPRRATMRSKGQTSANRCSKCRNQNYMLCLEGSPAPYNLVFQSRNWTYPQRNQVSQHCPSRQCALVNPRWSCSSRCSRSWCHGGWYCEHEGPGCPCKPSRLFA